MIRPMTEADRKGKALVHYQSWQETYPGIMDSRVLSWQSMERCLAIAQTRPENTLVLLERGAENCAAGFAAWVPQAREFVSIPGASEITGLYLLRKYQGHGLGGRLLAECLKNLPNSTVVLFVLEGNQKAIDFYTHCGFRLTGQSRTEEINGGTVTELEMYLENEQNLQHN